MTNTTIPFGSRIDTATGLVELPYQSLSNPHSPYYGALTEQPSSSWADGSSWLCDPITGYAFCPIEPGEPGPLIDNSGEWLGEIIEAGLTP